MSVTIGDATLIVILFMESQHVNPIVQFGRNLYQSLPGNFRLRLERAPLIQGLRESMHNGEEIPYILLQEQHIANLKPLLNRNALLKHCQLTPLLPKLGSLRVVSPNAFSNFLLLVNCI